jgi:hypothetical protein
LGFTRVEGLNVFSIGGKLKNVANPDALKKTVASFPAS